MNYEQALALKPGDRITNVNSGVTATVAKAYVEPDWVDEGRDVVGRVETVEPAALGHTIFIRRDNGLGPWERVPQEHGNLALDELQVSGEGKAALLFSVLCLNWLFCFGACLGAASALCFGASPMENGEPRWAIVICAAWTGLGIPAFIESLKALNGWGYLD